MIIMHNLLGMMFIIPFFAVLIGFGCAIAYDYSNDGKVEGLDNEPI